MVLTSQAKTDCPASDEAPFATLGDVDRLGAAFCAEPHASELIARIQGYRAFRMQCLATTLGILHACRPPARAVVSLRLKRLDSIRRKITRRGANFKLGTLDDVIGVRVICSSISDVIALSTRLESSPHVHRVKDYIEAPAVTGYRAIHHIMRFQQPVSADRSLTVRYEIQARTYLQHRWAVWSEAHGERAKIGQADLAHHQQLRAVSLDITRWEEDNPTRPQHELLPYSGGPHRRGLLAARARARHAVVVPRRRRRGRLVVEPPRNGLSRTERKRSAPRRRRQACGHQPRSSAHSPTLRRRSGRAPEVLRPLGIILRPSRSTQGDESAVGGSGSCSEPPR